MKIRRIVKLAALIPLALALIVAIIYGSAFRQLAAAKQKADFAEQIAVGAFELNLLSYEFVHYSADRARLQWQRKHAEIARLLEQAALDNPRERDLLSLLRHDHRQMEVLFAKLVEAAGSPQEDAPADGLADEWRNRLVAQLLLRCHNMLAAARTLGTASRDELIRIQTRTDTAVLAALLVFAGALVGSSWVVLRKVGSPLARLQEGVRGVGAGHFDVTLPAGGRDEIGDICRAFNDMAGSLKRSHGELRREIADRRRAQEALRKAHDELELRVRERTADLTRANAELESSRQAAEAASRAKSTFLANMSHEIRTPLNAVIGMTELVLKSPLTAQQREYLMTVKDSGEALLSVINDILDFSKIEAGKLVLDDTVFDLRESLGDTMKSFAFRAHQRGLELTCFIHTAVPRFVHGDYNRLRQVVVNLVGNALKFTDRGEVGLEVSEQARSEDDTILHFTVHDTGVGIPEDKRATIFEMFEQGDGSMTRRHAGTGLGLAIAARLVALMDGHIGVESEPGRGSRFHFSVRLGLASEPGQRPAAAPACLDGMPVLVVDDNATNRHILEETLQSWKMSPTTAANAKEAADLLQWAHEAGDPYRLVLTDAHMPLTDGFTLAEQIKQDPALGSTVIMMLTSGDRPEDTARCNQLGIAAYLLKPVKQSELLEAIEMALGITVPEEELRRLAVRQPCHVSGLRVLLAEDSLVNQQLAVALLEGQGHTVTVVSNGAQAVAAAQSRPFDLVLMDVQMPEMDGLEATAQIRAGDQPAGARLPIIAMTAYAMKGDRERCLEAGMDAYLAKPIRAEELFATIDTLFADRQGAPSAGPGAPAQAVDWARALQAVRGNRKVLEAIVAAALEEIPQLMDALRSAMAEGDAAKLRRAAHTLKGAVRYFGADGVYDQAAKLEELGRAGDLEQCPAVLTTLEAEIVPVIAAMAGYGA